MSKSICKGENEIGVYVQLNYKMLSVPEYALEKNWNCCITIWKDS